VSHQKATPPGVAKRDCKRVRRGPDCWHFLGAFPNPTNSLGPCVYGKKGLRRGPRFGLISGCSANLTKSGGYCVCKKKARTTHVNQPD